MKNLPFVEIGRRGNVRADCDLNKRTIHDLSEILCAPQVRYTISYKSFLQLVKTSYSNFTIVREIQTWYS